LPKAKLESAKCEWRDKARAAELERLETSGKTKRQRSKHARQVRQLQASKELSSLETSAPDLGEAAVDSRATRAERRQPVLEELLLTKG
jgi:hypothetical protein